MKIVNTILVLVVFGVVFFFVQINSNGYFDISNFNNSGSEKESFFLMTSISLSMLIGIFCGEIYRTLEKGRSRKLKKSDISGIFTEKSLWRSLISSPLIFGGVYSLAKGQTDLLMAILFAFENGFFCNLILSEKKNEIKNRTTPNNG